MNALICATSEVPGSVSIPGRSCSGVFLHSLRGRGASGTVIYQTVNVRLHFLIGPARSITTGPAPCVKTVTKRCYSSSTFRSSWYSSERRRQACFRNGIVPSALIGEIIITHRDSANGPLILVCQFMVTLRDAPHSL